MCEVRSMTSWYKNCVCSSHVVQKIYKIFTTIWTNFM
jgi:hypothetical protein